VSAVVLTVAALVAGVLAIRHFGNPRDGVVLPVSSSQLQLEFSTDGVLTESKLRQQLDSVLRQPLRSVDVHAVKEQLESSGQVAHAAVALDFPDRIQVRLQERTPLLRIRVRGEGGLPQELLIATDGHIYAGENYPEDARRAIPGATGLRLRRMVDGTYQPLEAVGQIAAFLETAQREIPAIARHWRVLDLSDWQPQGGYRASLIRIRSVHIEELVFSMDEPDRQMRRLAAILEHAQRYQLGQPVFIDLSFHNESVIRYAN
jgi:hypothetical protein